MQGVNHLQRSLWLMKRLKRIVKVGIGKGTMGYIIFIFCVLNIRTLYCISGEMDAWNEDPHHFRKGSVAPPISLSSNRFRDRDKSKQRFSTLGGRNSKKVSKLALGIFFYFFVLCFM